MSSLKQEIVLYNSLVDQIIEAGGEITPELESEMKRLPQKVDAAVFVLDRLVVDIEFFKSRAKYFSEVAKQIERSRGSFEDYIKHNMEENGIQELEGEQYKLKLHKCPPSVEVENEELLDPAYKRQKVEILVDKIKIKEDLSLGIPVEGARLIFNTKLKPVANKRLK